MITIICNNNNKQFKTKANDNKRKISYNPNKV